MQLTTTASAFAAGSNAAMLFDRVADPAAAAEFFRGFGPIPAIDCVRPLSQPALAAGARREVVLVDGSTLLEEIVEFERPLRHRYRIERFGPPLSHLLRTGEGSWTFADEAGGARVSWSYQYELASLWMLPVAALFVKVLMHGAMHHAVERIGQWGTATAKAASLAGNPAAGEQS